MLFARGGRKAGESPGFDFKFRKEFRPVSVEENERRARGGREEGGEASSVEGEPRERREGGGKEGGGERREKN